MITEDLRLIGSRPNGNGQHKEEEALPEPDADPTILGAKGAKAL